MKSWKEKLYLKLKNIKKTQTIQNAKNLLPGLVRIPSSSPWSMMKAKSLQQINKLKRFHNFLKIHIKLVHPPYPYQSYRYQPNVHRPNTKTIKRKHS